MSSEPPRSLFAKASIKNAAAKSPEGPKGLGMGVGLEGLGRNVGASGPEAASVPGKGEGEGEEGEA